MFQICSDAFCRLRTVNLFIRNEQPGTPPFVQLSCRQESCSKQVNFQGLRVVSTSNLIQHIPSIIQRFLPAKQKHVNLSWLCLPQLCLLALLVQLSHLLEIWFLVKEFS